MAGTGDWQNGLCGCFNDIGLCIITYFVPCYTQGKNAEVVGESCLLCGLSLMVPLLNIYARVTTRGKIRDQRGIPGGCCHDFLLVIFCSLCTLVQEGQEVKAMGGQAVDNEKMERE
ncbi:unnamed protein product [Dimorphilus gyrociliatus]|uniref:Uncharacterized protein n=1 Tax=Dimorphilus gyrociliatus TaxID=2664684 RepID=A0A7I8V8T2_9ANNE|nr:unnamed protein product [Dimorphilus gyrociliatus]